MYSLEETMCLRRAPLGQVGCSCPGSKEASNRRGVGEVTSECRLREVLLMLSFNALCCHVRRVKRWWQVSSVCSSIREFLIKAWSILVEEVISTGVPHCSAPVVQSFTCCYGQMVKLGSQVLLGRTETWKFDYCLSHWEEKNIGSLAGQLSTVAMISLSFF